MHIRIVILSLPDGSHEPRESECNLCNAISLEARALLMTGYPLNDVPEKKLMMITKARVLEQIHRFRHKILYIRCKVHIL